MKNIMDLGGIQILRHVYLRPNEYLSIMSIYNFMEHLDNKEFNHFSYDDMDDEGIYCYYYMGGPIRVHDEGSIKDYKNETNRLIKIIASYEEVKRCSRLSKKKQEELDEYHRALEEIQKILKTRRSKYEKFETNEYEEFYKLYDLTRHNVEYGIKKISQTDSLFAKHLEKFVKTGFKGVVYIPHEQYKEENIFS